MNTVKAAIMAVVLGCILIGIVTSTMATAGGPQPLPAPSYADISGDPGYSSDPAGTGGCGLTCPPPQLGSAASPAHVPHLPHGPHVPHPLRGHYIIRHMAYRITRH